MLRPERRSAGDLIAVVVIIVVLAVAAVVVWHGSDARGTTSQPAASPAPTPSKPGAPPGQLTEVWRAPSPATPKPTVAGPAAVTARGGDVLGRDPATGAVRWRFSRDRPLCTVSAEWGRALAVYRKGDFCSEVTSLNGRDGQIGPQRNDDARPGTRLLSDGEYVTATGRRLIESWRSDLVRTQQYGHIPDPLNSGKQPRPNCDYGSVAVGSGRVGVVEHCPGDSHDRITLLKAKPSSHEQPEDLFSTVTGGHPASVVAVSENRAAVWLPNPSRLVIYSPLGSVEARYPVEAAPGPPAPNGVRVAPTETSAAVYWYTGRGTVALSRSNLHPLWTAPDALGPGTLFGGKLLLPVPGGLAVTNPLTGARERVIPVDRHGYHGPVTLDAVGSTVLEQRGNTLAALR